MFNFAADMGGMGYIQSNHAYILYNNTMITFNMVESARRNGVLRSVCVKDFSVSVRNVLTRYPSWQVLIYFVSLCVSRAQARGGGQPWPAVRSWSSHRRWTVPYGLVCPWLMSGGRRREEEAWPAQPQDAYGLEKLYGEVLCKHYMEDYGMEMRVARLHNIYGPKGAWKGGRYKLDDARFACSAIVPCG